MVSISKHYTELKTWEDIYNEAVFLRIKGDFKGALNLHLSIIELDTENDFPAQFHNLGFLLLKDNQKEKAVIFLNKGLELYDRIIDKLTKFQNLNPTNNKETSDDFDFPDLPDWHEDESIAFYIYGKSSINALLGNKEECLKLLEEAIQLDEYFSLEAEKDDDFVELLSDPDFIQLLNKYAQGIKFPNHPNLVEMYDEIFVREHIGFDWHEYYVLDLIDSFSERFESPLPITWIRYTAQSVQLLHMKECLEWPELTDPKKLAEAFNILNKSGILSIHGVGIDELNARFFCQMHLEESENLDLKKCWAYCVYDFTQLEEIVAKRTQKLSIYFDTNELMFSEKGLIEIRSEIIFALEKQGFKVSYSIESPLEIVIKNIDWKKIYVNYETHKLWDFWEIVSEDDHKGEYGYFEEFDDDD